jgi:predicted alpha/beta-fold hydrolase
VATPHFYSASYTADLRAVIISLQQQYPRTPLVACGYSLGANILCRSASQSSCS